MTMRTRRRRSGPVATGTRLVQIIVTPGSGNGRALTTALQLREGLRTRGHQTRLEALSDLDSLGRWTATADPNLSLLICVGGDGTLSAAAAAAVRHSIPFLPVPTGFGNLFARALGLTNRVDRALDLLEHGTLVQVDVGVRNGELFLCQESYGLLSEIQHRVEESVAQPRARWRRCLAYYRMALRYLGDAPLTPLEVVVDGRVVARDAVVVAVANVETYGAWLRLTPDASPVDGLFDVFTMSGATKRAVLARLLKRQLRLPGTEEGTQVCRGRRVSVTAPHQARNEHGLIPRVLPVLVPSEKAEALTRDLVRVYAPSQPGARRVA
jgi:diacylglycerol kinase (ATP)